MSAADSSPNPFAAWQRLFQEWSKATQAGARTPLDAWTQAARSWATPANPPTPSDPWHAWRQTLDAWTRAATGAVPTADAGAASPNPTEAWLATFQKWAEASNQFLSMGRGGSEPGLFNPFQAFNPFQSFAPAQIWQQLLQQHLKTWTDFLAAPGDGSPSAELFRTSEKNWLAYLDSTGRELAAAMSTDEFAKALGISIEQALATQDRLMESFDDQVNAFIRFFQLPSRSQVERLFERVIGLEDRLDELEDQNRAILKLLRQIVGTTAEAGPAGEPGASIGTLGSWRAQARG